MSHSCTFPLSLLPLPILCSHWCFKSRVGETFVLYSEKWGGSKNRSTIEISKGGKIGVGGFRVNIDKWAFRISWSFEKCKQLCQSNHMGKIKLVFLATEALAKERGREDDVCLYLNQHVVSSTRKMMNLEFADPMCLSRTWHSEQDDHWYGLISICHKGFCSWLVKALKSKSTSCEIKTLEDIVGLLLVYRPRQCVNTVLTNWLTVGTAAETMVEWRMVFECQVCFFTFEDMITTDFNCVGFRWNASNL